MSPCDLRIPRHNPRTASRLYSGEAVIICPAEGMVRMLNRVGSRIWELADGTRSVAEIAAVLAAEFAVAADDAQASVARFLAELEARGLIVWADAQGPGSCLPE